MEKLVANDLSKLLILLSMGFAGIFILFVNMVVRLKGKFKPYQKSTILYLLVSLIFFAAIAGTGYWHASRHYLTFFLLYQCCFLLLGVVHVYWMEQHLKWSGMGALWAELLFTVVTSITGSIVFLLVYRWFNPQGLVFHMAGSIILFMVPWFVHRTFQYAITIPPRVLKQWYYPVSEEIEEPDEKKLKHLLVISFEFQKQVTDAHFTNFRAKAPVDMDLGELFYYFVNDYNDRHPHAKIEFINGNGEPHGWVFYKKPKWYSLMMQYIDAEQTVFKNRIRENDVIICRRSLN
jgi:hypothetical protein